MARREGHLLEIGGVPRAEDDAAVVRRGAQLPHDLGQLVDALARVVRPAADVLGAEVAPLEPVHGAEVADGAVGQPHAVQELPRPVAVPDPDALLRQRQRRRVALHEPEELRQHRLEEHALRRQEGQDRFPRCRVVEAEF